MRALRMLPRVSPSAPAATPIALVADSLRGAAKALRSPFNRHHLEYPEDWYLLSAVPTPMVRHISTSAPNCQELAADLGLPTEELNHLTAHRSLGEIRNSD